MCRQHVKQLLQHQTTATALAASQLAKHVEISAGPVFPTLAPRLPRPRSAVKCLCHGAPVVTSAVLAERPPLPASTPTHAAPHAGSYIFSQCLLAVRSGVRSRAQGATLSVGQLVVFLLPLALVQLLPNFYYGSLLIVIGADIMHEWLVATRLRIKRAEFVLSWLAFIATVLLTAMLPVKVRPPPPPAFVPLQTPTFPFSPSVSSSKQPQAHVMQHVNLHVNQTR